MRIPPAPKRRTPGHLNELGLASAVAHEVRRVLTPARAYAELALAGPPLSSEASQAVLAILKAAQDCEDVLEALVVSGGSESGDSAEVEAVARQIRSAHASISQGLQVSMSPTRLLIVLSNLAANGAKASGGQVEISAKSSTGNTVEIRVTDRGVGMSPSQVHQSIKPFVSFSSGSGMGLAICQHLVQEAGGRMWITSTEGKGTCVTVELPAAAAELKKSA